MFLSWIYRKQAMNKLLLCEDCNTRYAQHVFENPKSKLVKDV